MVKFNKFGFYEIDPAYLKYLHEKDAEVYYNKSYHSLKKPFIGIVVGIGEYQYFIPISSAKEKHIKWKNVSDAHLLIYELVDNNLNIQSHVYKPYDNRQKVHVLSVLDIKKMLPVPDGAYNFIDFDELKDEKYRDLFEKEYNFCLRIREKILYKAEKLYNKQMEAKIVRNMYCDFKKLESALLEWKL